MKLKIEFQNTLGLATTADDARQVVVRVDDAELIEMIRAALRPEPVTHVFTLGSRSEEKQP